jgi:hypothetical protein
MASASVSSCSVRRPFSVRINLVPDSVTRPFGVGSEHVSDCRKCESGEVCRYQHVGVKSVSGVGVSPVGTPAGRHTTRR